MLLRACVLVAIFMTIVEGYPQQPRGSHAEVASTALQNVNKRNAKDNSALGTGFHHQGHHLHPHGAHHLGHGAGAHHGHGKFFMYAHQPAHKHYEFGFKRGNDKHVVERYEKGGPHHDFKSKFRWHDKHGGHGERYWDYNHGPHHHHDDGGDDGHHHDGHHGGGDDDDGHHGYHSEPVPDYVNPGNKEAASFRQRRKSHESPIKESHFVKKPTGMGKKMFVGPKDINPFTKPMGVFPPAPAESAQPAAQSQPMQSQSAFDDMLGFDPFQPPEILKEHSSVGETRDQTPAPPAPAFQTTQAPVMSQPFIARKNKPKKFQGKKYKASASRYNKSKSQSMPKLAFDLDSGRVFDENTGKWFRLVSD